MAELSFDDLIPANAPANPVAKGPAPLNFDDLVPATQAQPETDEQARARVSQGLPWWMGYDNWVGRHAPSFLGPQPGAFSKATDLAADSATLGLSSEVKPLAALIASGGSAEAYHAAKQAELNRLERDRQDLGPAHYIPEVVGGFGGLAPAEGLATALTKAPTYWQGVKTAGKAAVPYGAVAGATGSDGTLGERATDTGVGALISGLTGAGLQGVAVPVAKSLYNTGHALVNATADVFNSDRAATRTVAKVLEQSKLDPDAISAHMGEGPPVVFDKAAPAPPSQASSPNDVESTLASSTASAPQKAPSSTTTTTSSDGQLSLPGLDELTPSAVLDHLSTLGATPLPVAQSSSVPFTFADAAVAAGKAARASGKGGNEIPILNLARNNRALGGEPELIATEAMDTRAANRPSRLSKAFSDAADGADAPSEIAKQDAILQDQVRKAYTAARDQQQDYDILPAITGYATDPGNAELLRTNSELGNGMRKALALFTLRPEAAAKVEMPAPGTRLSLAEYRKLLQQMDAAAATGGSTGQPIQGLTQYQAVKSSLDHLIKNNKAPDGSFNPLASKLIELRQAADTAVKASNPLYASADSLYSDARTAKELIDMGQKAIFNAGVPQREMIQQFKQMTAPQQQLFRVGAAQKGQDAVTNRQTGNAREATQFNTDAFRNFIENVFPLHRSQPLLNTIDREIIAAQVPQKVLGGSPTTPIKEGIDALRENALVGASLARGDVGGALNKLALKQAREITSEKGAKIMKVLMSTDPAVLEPIKAVLAARGNPNPASTVLKRPISPYISALAARLAAQPNTAPPQPQPSLAQALSQR